MSEQVMKIPDCPLKFGSVNSLMEPWACKKEKCAWWCEWIQCCAMVAIPSEISNRLDEIRRAINP